MAADADKLLRLLPEPPLLAAGALGGPVVIASLTPLRNAMSNAAQDQASSLPRLYLNAVGGSGASLLARLRIGFTGAMVSAGPAVPQWTIIGPFFHALHLHLPRRLLKLRVLVENTVVSSSTLA